MNPGMSLDKKSVEAFLKEMKQTLCKDDFDLEHDFIFIRERKYDDINDEFSNDNTMLELGYDSSDVVGHLKTLTIEEYTDFMLDDKPGESEGLCFFFVFGRVIDGRDVYIKVRMKNRKSGKAVFCISFHFARHKIVSFPFR